MAVHVEFYHGLWQYMAVHGTTVCCLSLFMAVHATTWRYKGWICAAGGAVAPANFRALLKALHCLHHPWQLPPVIIACANSSIHALVLLALARSLPPPLPSGPAAGEALGEPLGALARAAAAAGSTAAAASSAVGGTGAGVTSRDWTLAPPAPSAGGLGGDGLVLDLW